MKTVDFDFTIRPVTVQSDREKSDIKSLDNRGLRRIAKGKIFVTFEKQREFFVIESEVIDYLEQLKIVTEKIDSGTHEIVAVSGDYFSNNLRFTYDPPSKKIEIYEANGASFTIKVSYKEYRSSLLAFFKQAMKDLKMLYPELARNEEFCKMM